MNVLLKQLCRSRLFTAVIVLLLIISVVMGCVGLSAYYAAQEQLSYVEGLYTSIAVIRAKTEKTGIKIWQSAYFPHELQRTLDESPFHLTFDRRCMLAATVSDNVSLTTRSFDPWSYDEIMDRPYSEAVLAVRCRKVQIREVNTGYEKIDDESWRGYTLSKIGDQSKFTKMIAPLYYFNVE